jgi:hypothetical protein
VNSSTSAVAVASDTALSSARASLPQLPSSTSLSALASPVPASAPVARAGDAIDVDLTTAWRAFASAVNEWSGRARGMDMRARHFSWDSMPQYIRTDVNAVGGEDDIREMLDELEVRLPHEV